MEKVIEMQETPSQEVIEQKGKKLATQLKKIKKMKEEFESEEEDVDQDPDRQRRWDRDHKIVRGQFHYHEIPGGTLSFSFLKWPGDSVKTYTLKDGEITTIPLMVTYPSS